MVIVGLNYSDKVMLSNVLLLVAFSLMKCATFLTMILQFGLVIVWPSNICVHFISL